MELFHKLRSKNYIDMSYWFSKKGQAYSVPHSGGVMGKNRRYNTYKYYKDGKAVLVFSTVKEYYIEFPYHEALFFYLDSKEKYLSGSPIEDLADKYFQPDWKKM